MTDISELREGDEIEVVMRMRVITNPSGVKLAVGSGVDFPIRELWGKTFTVIRPEIVPGKAYVDAEGKLYVGKTNGRLVYVSDDGTGIYFHACGLPDYRPLPAGLRPAMIVPEPATHDGPRRTVDAPAVHSGGRVVAE